MKQLFSSLVLVAIGISAMAQQTVNVNPGDDLQAAVEQAGAGGTVIFAPGLYNIAPSDPSAYSAIEINENHEGITLQGAGSGFDPITATIFNGDAGFLGRGINLAFGADVTVEGITFTSFWDAAIQIDNTETAVIRDCWMVACKRAVYVEGSSGFYDYGADTEDYSEMIQFYNCVMAKAQDLIMINDFSSVLFMNCDIRDSSSDIFECEEDSLTLIRNCIINAGLLTDDVQPEGAAIVDIANSLFYEADEPDGTIDEMDHGGLAIFDETLIYADAMYVNANFAAPINELDFHLLPDSPALTAGKDENGNLTFAGSAGPVQ